METPFAVIKLKQVEDFYDIFINKGQPKEFVMAIPAPNKLGTEDILDKEFLHRNLQLQKIVMEETGYRWTPGSTLHLYEMTSDVLRDFAGYEPVSVVRGYTQEQAMDLVIANVKQ